MKILERKRHAFRPLYICVYLRLLRTEFTAALASHRVVTSEIVQIVSVVVAHSNIETVLRLREDLGTVRLSGDQSGLE